MARTPRKIGWRCCGPLVKTLALFMTKIFDFSYPIIEFITKMAKIDTLFMTKIVKNILLGSTQGISQEYLICNEGFYFCKWKEFNFTQPFESSKGAHLQKKSTKEAIQEGLEKRTRMSLYKNFSVFTIVLSYCSRSSGNLKQALTQ